MRLSPGWFNHRDSGVWWNCLRSAASIIDTSGERRSHLVLFGRSLTLHLASASLKKSWQADRPDPLFRPEDHVSGLRSPDRAQKDIKREKLHHLEVLANHMRYYKHPCSSDRPRLRGPPEGVDCKTRFVANRLDRRILEAVLARKGDTPALACKRPGRKGTPRRKDIR